MHFGSFFFFNLNMQLSNQNGHYTVVEGERDTKNACSNSVILRDFVVSCPRKLPFQTAFLGL